MLKKAITYKDFDDNDVTETFYFNLTKAEIIEMEVSDGGVNGLTKLIERVVETQNKKELIRIFKEIIVKAYGEKSSDGHFVKNKEISDAFTHTEAYSQLFMELATNADAAAAFMNGIIPKS